MTSPLQVALQRASANLPDEGSRSAAVIRRFEFASNVPIAELTGKSQAAPITELRHQLMYVIRELVPEASYSTIGRFVGGRDMATVHEAIRKVYARAEGDPAYALALERMIDAVRRLGRDPVPARSNPWQITAAASVLRDDALTDTEARKVALTFLSELEGSHA